MALPGSTVPPVGYGELTEEIARISFDSKFWGPFWAVFDGRGHMRRGGSIVLFSGVAAQRPVPGYVVGGCINGALEAATRSLAPRARTGRAQDQYDLARIHHDPALRGAPRPGGRSLSVWQTLRQGCP